MSFRSSARYSWHSDRDSTYDLTSFRWFLDSSTLTSDTSLGPALNFGRIAKPIKGGGGVESASRCVGMAPPLPRQSTAHSIHSYPCLFKTSTFRSSLTINRSRAVMWRVRWIRLHFLDLVPTLVHRLLQTPTSSDSPSLSRIAHFTGYAFFAAPASHIFNRFSFASCKTSLSWLSFNLFSL